MGIHILLQYSNRQHLHQLFQTHHTNPNTTINNNTINMTDDSRKGLGDKVQEKVTPQESKSTTDKVKEGVTNTADKAQRDAVPDDQKSSGQAAADKASRTADSHKDDKSMMDKAKETLGMGGNNKRSTTSAAPTRHDRQSIPLSINNPCDTILHSGCRLSFLTYGFGI